jgi:hypothetical protein
LARGLLPDRWQPLFSIVFPMKKILLALILTAGALSAQGADYPELTGSAMPKVFPYSMIGQLLFDSGADAYSGSGTVIAPKSVLTAGHNLYDADEGWSTGMQFRRGLYGARVLSEQYASRLYVLGGYRTSVATYGPDANRSFARDMGAVIFSKNAAGGSSASWSTNLARLTGTAYNIALGYGGEFHDGDHLLKVEPQFAFTKTYGAFYENDSIYIESGMSGGPVFARTSTDSLVVSGVVVSGSTDPVTGGIRALDSTAGDFIRLYFH